MVAAGYGNRKEQKKSLKEVFELAVKLAERENNIKRTAKGWQKKFTRIKQDYSAYIAKISISGRDGDDEGLYDKPEYFKQMHELEHNKARHAPPAVLSTDAALDSSEPTLSSSRKKIKLSNNSAVAEYIEQQKDRQDALLLEIKKSNEEKAKMREVMERLVERL